MSGVAKNTYVEMRARYNAGWTPPPTEYPNEKFTKPNPPTVWARFNLSFGDEIQMDIGDNLKTFRTQNQLIIQLFAPSEQGSIDILAKADSITTVFRNWCGVTVTCREATVRIVGNDGFGWFQVNVIIEFKVDALH